MNIKNQPTAQQDITISSRQLESLYALGFELYGAGEFEKAADLFRLLCLYDPEKSRNWIALGGANQQRGEYQLAIAAFVMASFQEPLSPEPRLYAAHSFIDLMDLSAALEATKQALELCEKRDDKKEVQSRASSLLQALESYTQK
ncbi:MAG: SycD/LcrH family type III secretion system chaperone [Verrucomicrobiae bacterium]|jgi:type III secretion system low calcium response chaperone LcrH/SycD|nr:SycD/LcrH family type III secretion system chaperone [Verrucomicrobiae bacterium]